jgi:hypothetical protein
MGQKPNYLARKGARGGAPIGYQQIGSYPSSKGDPITGKAGPGTIQSVFLIWFNIRPTSVYALRLACAETG